MEAGETLRLLPVPTVVPPHEPECHVNVVPDPPEYESVVLLPLHIVVDVALTEAGATGSGFTVIVTVLHVDVPQPLVHAP